jgi:peptidyl-prolyl cis-trans isomerase D
MLQRIHDSVGKWMASIVLGLISVGFIFWGVDFGLNGAANFAAKVNGENIALTEFDRELQVRQSQYQQQFQVELTEDMRRQLRRSVIESMVNDAVLKQRVAEERYRVSDERLAEYIRSAPAFQVDGQFSIDVYRGLLQNQGLTPTGFEQAQRENLEVLDLQAGIADSTFLTPAEFRRYIELYNERRDVAFAEFGRAAFADGVTIDDAAIAAHYESNQAAYQTTETVDIEYVELELADIADTIEVTDDALRAMYEQERERFQTAEERRARHILFNVIDGNEDEARAKAEAALARINGGEDFAAVANDVSEDAGTKAQGGDLGWIARDMLPGAFEDALFGMQTGEVRGPIRSDFGYHVIRMDELREGDEQSFEAVRDELAAEYRTREAEREFYDRANELGDRAFDAYNELANVASELRLPLKTLTGLSRAGDPIAFPNNAPVVQAAFSEEIVDSGRNSQLLELADDHVVVLRVTMHHVPTTQPLEVVRDQIRQELIDARTQERAEAAATAFLSEVEQGADPATAAASHGGVWHEPETVQRTDEDLPSEVLSTAFGLPKVGAGVVQREQVALAAGGYAVVVVSNVQPGDAATVSQAERDQRQQQLADQAALAELTSYAGTLRERATVRIPDEVLEPQY